jgi:hypothetical protein
LRDKAAALSLAELTICKIDQIETLGAGRVFKSLQPQLDGAVGMATTSKKGQRMVPFKLRALCVSVVCVSVCAYRWNIIHCAAVAMLSWLSLRADSFASTASGV